MLKKLVRCRDAIGHCSSTMSEARTPIGENHNDNSNFEISPLLVNVDNDIRPYISVKMYGLEVVALLDTGATSTILGRGGQYLIDQFNIDICPPDSSNVFVADGSKQKVTGIVYLPIIVDNSCKLVRGLIVPSISHSLILGVDFARQFQLKVDFKDNEWKVQSKNQVSLVSEENDNDPKLISLDNLSFDQRVRANRAIESFNEISSKDRLGRSNKLKMHIDTGNNKPFRKKQYPMSPYMLKVLNNELDEMIKLGVVKESKSPWCSPVLLVKKKNGEFRFCFDGRPLNEITKYDSYPLPRIDAMLDMLADAVFITSIDLRKAFWQIPLDEESKEKTAFGVPGRGLFEFEVMPFGLCNAAQKQQRLVDTLFGPRYEKNIFSYLDDILIISRTFEEHLQLLTEAKEILKDAGLTINLEKCEFFKPSLKFLGFVVSSKGIHTDPEKVASMINYPRPTNATEVKRFLGLCSWYRRFIKNFSSLVSPLNGLLRGRRKKQPVSWTKEAEESFTRIKEALVSAPILSHPDFTLPFSIQCDASDTGIGGVLTQEVDGQERVIAYASRSLTKAEKVYHIVEKECLAVIFSIEKFRSYIEGVHFTVYTDNQSLLWINNLKNPTGRLARWAMRLRQHTFSIIHRKGSSNVVADALSRLYESNVHIDVIEVNDTALDKWYLTLRRNIRDSPSQFPQWKIENGTLYKFLPNKLPLITNLPEWKILMPKSQRNEVIRSCHDTVTSAHFGFYKTLARVQDLYYWPHMRRDILKYVKRCKVCNSQKASNLPRIGHMGEEKAVQYPWQIISVDLMGPFPRSKKGNTHLLVVGDWMTKYTLLFPLKKATAENIVKYVESEVFLIFGVPQFILCDNGTQFAGKVFKKLADEYRVQKIWFTPRYSPQCNFVERINKTVGTAIRCFIDEHNSWDKELPKIRQAINTARHEVTGYTPAFLNFARHVPASGDFYGKAASTKDLEIVSGDRESYAAELSHLSIIFDDVRRKLHEAYKRNARNYNLRKRDLSFEEGDLVWKKNKVLSSATDTFSAKLAPRKVLCRVKKKISKLVYDLVHENGSNAGEWHIKDLEPYFGSNSDISVG